MQCRNSNCPPERRENTRFSFHCYSDPKPRSTSPITSRRARRRTAQVRLQRTAVVAIEDVPDIGEDALHLPQAGLAAQAQRNAAAAAVEQGVAEVVLKRPDAIGAVLTYLNLVITKIYYL